MVSPIVAGHTGATGPTGAPARRGTGGRRSGFGTGARDSDVIIGETPASRSRSGDPGGCHPGGGRTMTSLRKAAAGNRPVRATKRLTDILSNRPGCLDLGTAWDISEASLAPSIRTRI